MTDTDVPAGPGEGDDGGDVGSPPPPWWRRWWMWAAALAVVLVAVGVTVWAVQDDDGAEDATPTTTSTTTTTTTTTSTTTTTTTVPTTTTQPTTTTVAAVAAWVNEDRQRNNIDLSEVVCADTGPIAVGGVLACEATPLSGPLSGELAGLTVYVLDTTGRAAYSGGTDIPESAAGVMARYDAAPKGLYCRDLLSDDINAWPFSQGPTPDARAYFWSLVYWSLEGEPDRMDADLNGIPCETLYGPDVVAQVLNGGFISA